MSILVILSAQFLAAAALSLVAVGCYLALKSPWRAAVVVAPLVALVPWQARGLHGEASARLALAACALWVFHLLIRQGVFVGRRRFYTAAALSTAALLVSPAGIIMLAAMGVILSIPRTGTRFPSAPLAFIALPVSVKAAVEAFLRHKAAFAWLSNISLGWAAPQWYMAAHGKPFNVSDALYNRGFFWPLLIALAVLLVLRRRQWWFGPTALMATVLFVGSVVLGAGLYFQYSLTTQIALIVFFGIAAIAKEGEIKGQSP